MLFAHALLERGVGAVLLIEQHAERGDAALSRREGRQQSYVDLPVEIGELRHRFEGPADHAEETLLDLVLLHFAPEGRALAVECLESLGRRLGVVLSRPKQEGRQVGIALGKALIDGLSSLPATRIEPLRLVGGESIDERHELVLAGNCAKVRVAFKILIEIGDRCFRPILIAVPLVFGGRRGTAAAHK